MNTVNRQTTLVLLVALAILVAGYWLVRFGGWTSEGDAARLGLAADAVVAQGRLDTTGRSYANGYGFQALLATLAVMTGSTPAAMQDVTTFWLAALAIGAFILYRQLLADGRLAVLGVVVLLLMPDFLFPVLRASHERITWTFSMLLMALWLRNLDTQRPLRAAALVAATYLLFWAMIAANVFMATTVLATFAFALALSVVTGAVLSGERNMRHSRRMAYILLAGIVLVFLFVFFAYTPARLYIRTVASTAERLAVLLLGAEEVAAPASVSYWNSAWRSTYVYFGLTMFQYAVLAASFAAWINVGWRMIRGGWKQISIADSILWLLYFGIGLQVAIGLSADLSGALAGNLQVRYMAPFLILAVVMATTWLEGSRLPRLSWQRKRTIQTAGMILLGLGLVAALLKATNDPLVGNYWAFYQPQEKRAIFWVDENLSGANVWLDVDTTKHELLASARDLGWEPTNNYSLYGSSVRPSHILISALIREKAIRYGIALPFLESHNRIYDAGQTQVFHRRPVTPFQR